MHLSVKVPIEYPIKAIHIKVNSTIQAAKVESLINHPFYTLPFVSIILALKKIVKS